MAETSSVSAHLGIPLEEYDARIRTFVPHYQEMLDVASGSIALAAKSGGTLLELGIGTGALAGQCRRLRPDLMVVGVDADAGMLAMARHRLGTERVSLMSGNFTTDPLPKCDVIVASLSFHHVRNAEEKLALYRRCRRVIDQDGCMVIADCFLPTGRDLVREGLTAWRAFLESNYSAAEAESLLDAWAGEDTYFPLREELAWLTAAGFEPEVLWRRELFGVVLCT